MYNLLTYLLTAGLRVRPLCTSAAVLVQRSIQY